MGRTWSGVTLVHSPMPGDAFDLLGIRPAFDLQPSEIEAAYLSLAASLHPDLAAGIEEAAHRMAEVNQAKAVLDHPESRADALLRRLGGPPAEREKSLPPGFLMDMMEVRERLEAAMQEPDVARRRENTDQWVKWSRDERERATRDVAAMFAAVPEADPGRAAALREIRVRLNAWRYVERLIEQLDPPN